MGDEVYVPRVFAYPRSPRSALDGHDAPAEPRAAEEVVRVPRVEPPAGGHVNVEAVASAVRSKDRECE